MTWASPDIPLDVRIGDSQEGADVVCVAVDHFADFDVSDQIHAIRTPTPIIVGRDDWVTSPSQAERMPHADVAIFEQSGHYPFIEAAEAFIETIPSRPMRADTDA